MIRSGVTGFNERLRTIVKIGERIHFIQQLSVLVPWPAVYLAPPDVGDHVDKTPVQQGKPCGTEGGIPGNAVGAISVKQGRVGPVQFDPLPVDDAHGDLFAVTGSGIDAVSLVVGRIKLPARYFVPLHEFLFP